METIKWMDNKMPKTNDENLSLMGLSNIDKVRKFHKSFPQYEETPLVNLKNMAGFLGLKDIFIKDESYRFGLNSFKVVGASFAMTSHIANMIGKDISELDYETLISDELHNKIGEVTFFTATDGNHGKAVSWTANKLNQKAVVRMPRGTSSSRLENIRKEGAIVTIEDANYDECVRIIANEASNAQNSIIVQDTAWEGYIKIPNWIMQGYGTVALEASEQLKLTGYKRPTHIFVQAGVGSFAAAVQGYFANLYPDNCPITVVVETNKADCYYKSAFEGDGKAQMVDVVDNSIMAGLACGEPNSIAWDILKNHCSFFVSCPDYVTAKGMRMLGAPVKGDLQVISGESGAVSMGLLATIMENDDYSDLRKELNLNKDSVVLMFSTEGDTDPENYHNIVWNGHYSSLEE